MTRTPGAFHGRSTLLILILPVLFCLCSCQWPLETADPRRHVDHPGPVDARWLWEEKRQAFKDGRFEELTGEQIQALESELTRCR